MLGAAMHRLQTIFEMKEHIKRCLQHILTFFLFCTTHFYLRPKRTCFQNSTSSPCVVEQTKVAFQTLSKTIATLHSHRRKGDKTALIQNKGFVHVGVQNINIIIIKRKDFLAPEK